MMQHDEQLMGCGGPLDQQYAYGDVPGQIEATRVLFRDKRLAFFLGRRPGPEHRRPDLGRQDDLYRLAVLLDDARAQGLMALDQVTDRGAQGGDAERSVEPQQDRDVVSRVAAKSVQQPGSPLSEGERNPVRA